MRTILDSPSIVSTEINGSFASLPEVIFQPSDFAALCGLVWRKPDTAIAVIAGVSDRAARDYLNGTVPMPGRVIAAINMAITRPKRLAKRRA